VPLGGKAALIAVLAAVGALGGAAAAGWGAPLGFLSFHINGTGVNVTWVPVYIDLGTLQEGQAVNATGQATITLRDPGVYVVNIVAPEHYARVFQYFNVTLTIDGNKTVNLSLRHPYAKVRLTAGHHEIDVVLHAKVRSHLPNITVEHAPFLAIHKLPPHHGHHGGRPASPGCQGAPHRP